jgi:hypothetical protein
MCCYACTCWCCFRHEISSMMGEHWCLWFINFAPLTHLRTKFRQQYAIEVKFNEKKKKLLFSNFHFRVQLLKIVVWEHFVHCVLHYNWLMKDVLMVIVYSVKNLIFCVSLSFLLLGE